MIRCFYYTYKSKNLRFLVLLSKSGDISFIEDKMYEAASRFKYCRNISYDEFLDRFTYIILAFKKGHLNFSNISGLKPLLVKLKDNHLE